MADLNDKKNDNLNDTLNDTLNQLTNTADTTDIYDPADIESNKIMALLSYIGILVLIPLFSSRQSPFTRFHVNQGLILLICSLVSWFVGSLSSTLAWVLNIAIFVLAIIGIFNVVKGEAKELPLVGKFRIIQ